MLASAKMARRAILFDKLIIIDDDLTFLFGEKHSIRVSSKARELLNFRAYVCDELILVGYQPWGLPIDMREAKVG